MAGAVPRTVFLARFAGFEAGGMGTVSNDFRDRESTEEARRRTPEAVAGAGRGGRDGGRGAAAWLGADRPGRVVEAVHEECSRDGFERGVDRAPRSREE